MFRVTFTRVQLEYFDGLEQQLDMLGLSEQRVQIIGEPRVISVSIPSRIYWYLSADVSSDWAPKVSIEAVAPLLLLPDAKSQMTYLIEEGYVDKDSKLAVGTLEHEPSPYLR